MALPLALAGTAAAGAYLNARLHIAKDLKGIALMKYGEKAWAKAVKKDRANIFYLFEENVHKYADLEFIWSRTGCYTWKETFTRICQYGNYFLSLGLKPGDHVAIYLQNSPEFIFVWYGLVSIACAPAFINYNIASDALVHCIKVSGANILLADSDEGCQERLRGSLDRIVSEAGVKPITFSEELKASIAMSDSRRPPDSLRETMKDTTTFCLIYTSGTTGFSKAVAVPMMRAYVGYTMAKYSLGQRPGKGGDRWYDCMPLYHGTGGLMAMMMSIVGTSIAISKKFSVKGFWPDIRASNSTAFIYVGETARYLLAAPPSPDDKNHNLRIMYGNGMRPDVWSKFQERFGVPEVAEFFNSTEGMLALVVYSRSGYGQGYVGHHGFLLRTVLHNAFVPVLIDPETGDPWRDPITGFVKRQPYAEGGEIVVQMADPTAFPGYYRAEKETNKKLIRDVFKKGDLYYRTGDALRRTDDGLWQFMDRLGDTFRWKGENVSTAEVGEVFGGYPGITEANVYGVLLPQHDGRAGCAAISTSTPEGLNWTELAAFARQKLPSYAVPLFIRVLSGEAGVLASHNNKQDKVRLRDEGVDPGKRGSRVPNGEGDRVYWLPEKGSGYVPFEGRDWEGISGGRVKL